MKTASSILIDKHEHRRNLEDIYDLYLRLLRKEDLDHNASISEEKKR